MAVIIKKDEKTKSIIERMTNRNDIEEFKTLFKISFPDDYVKMMKIFFSEERKDKKGKGHPMPHPDTYLSNMYKVAMKNIDEAE